MTSPPWRARLVSWRLPIAAVVVTLLARLITAAQFTTAGYSDAAYYTDVARSLATGQGFTDHSIWNYLYKPASIIHPSNGYWQPLVSITVAPFFRLFGSSFAVSEIAPIICSCGLTLLALWLGQTYLGGRWGAVLLAGWTIFGGFFAVHAAFPDTYSLYGLVGAGALAAAGAGLNGSRRAFVAAGPLAALGVLARSDGVLLLGAVAVSWVWAWWQYRTTCRPSETVTSEEKLAAPPGWRWVALSLGLAGLVLFPWYLRNRAAFGGWSPPGSQRVLFLLSFNDLYRWDTRILTPAYLFSRGWGGVLEPRLTALALNLFVLVIAAQFLWIPFTVIGVVRRWGRRAMLPPITFICLLVVVLTLFLPFHVLHGTMTRALAAVEPWIGIWSIQGLRAVAARLRPAASKRPYELIGMSYAVLFTGWQLWLGATQWYVPPPSYAAVEARFLQAHAPPSQPVLVADPPVVEDETGRPCLLLPSDGLDAAVAVADRYGARYLLLEQQSGRWRGSYAQIGLDPRFARRAVIGQIAVYELRPGAKP